ncbi:hypothetical protein [Methanobacterium sp. ACI-7]|uniref:hypothetical protein n=1 Tax=unclassified Methanobacterium TaxID=2627676 RepID=UPI0039C17EDD
MPYLICDCCDIYYEIERIEEMEELSKCECGNELKFYESIDDYINEELSTESKEEEKGIFHSVNKKNLVYMQMNMLKEQKETENQEREIRDLKYRIRHAVSNKEKLDDSENESLIMKLLRRKKK